MAVVAMLMLAGCAADELEDETESPETPEGDEAVRLSEIARPAWQVGDWWQYDITIRRDFAGAQSEFTLSPTIVVVEAGPGGYWTAAADPDDALTRFQWGDVWGGNHSADFDPLVLLTDASGTVAEEAANLYEWPMRLNKTWSGNLRLSHGGTEIQGNLPFQVLDVANQTLLGQDMRVATVRADGDLDSSARSGPEAYTIDYAFAEPAKNVVELTIKNETFNVLEMRMTGFGSNYTGEVVLPGLTSLYLAVKFVVPGVTSPGALPAPETFAVEAPYHYLHVQRGLLLYSPGRVSVALANPEGAVDDQANDQETSARWISQNVPTVQGEWGVSYQHTGISVAVAWVAGVWETTLTFQDGTPDRPPP